MSPATATSMVSSTMGGKFTSIGANLVGDGVHTVAAEGINDKGEICGYYVADAGDQAFIDIAGKITTINDPRGDGGSQALGVNSAGHVVGAYADYGEDSLFPSLLAAHDFTWA